MFGCLVNTFRHNKEKILSKEDRFVYYVLLTSFDNTDPYICVAVGKTEGELNLNVSKETYKTCFKFFIKLLSDKRFHLIGLRSNQILDLVDRGELEIEEHDFTMIY